MKNAVANQKAPDLLDEYDFSKGVRANTSRETASNYLIALSLQMICLNTISGVDKLAQ